MATTTNNIINSENSNDDTSSLNFLGTMTRYPFNGRAKNLIDDFYIIGYDYQTLYRELIKNNNDFLQNSFSTEEEKSKNIFQIKERPFLINKMSSDYSKEILDIDIIIDMIFPNKPNFYYEVETIASRHQARKSATLNKETLNNAINNNSIINETNKNIDNKNINNLNKEENKNNEIKNNFNFEQYSYNVIFSSNPQSGTNSKKSINGFAYIFYEKFINQRTIAVNTYSFYVPIVFCIISEYPYYNSFYKLTRQIKKLFISNNIEVPIEILIHNVLNFTLSPINGDVYLNIEPVNFFSTKTELNNSNISEKSNENKEENEKYFESINEVDDDITKHNTMDDDDYEKSDNNKNEKKGNYSSKNLLVVKKGKENVGKKKSGLQKNKTTFKLEETKNTKRRKVLESKNTDNIFKHSKYNLDTKKEKEKKTKSPNKNHINLNDVKKSETLRVKSMRLSLKDKALNFKENLVKKMFSSISSNSLNEFERQDNIKFEEIKFAFSPGYPLMQYNLCKVLLHTLNPFDVITIFLYTFFEKDIIFFSKNLEFLSLTINSYQNLNFPLNDEKYYFINGSVSYENYIGGNSTFVGSAFTTMVGINSSYNSNYISNSGFKLKEHLCVDLDAGEIHHEKNQYNKSEDNNRNKMFFDFVKKVCKSKEYKESKESSNNILLKEIRTLNEILNKCKEKYNTNKFSFIDYYNENDNENLIPNTNIKIQESFYKFIINICIYLYKNITITVGMDDGKKNDLLNMEVKFDSTYNISQQNYSKEEKYFLDELQDTMKFQSFVYGFIQSYNPIDLYKIPLTFTEEYISILSRKSNIKMDSINFLSLIDRLYYKMGRERTDVEFLPFLSEYYKNYKKDFDREIKEIYSENLLKNDIIIKLNKKNEIEYTWFELENMILIKYLNLLNNLSEDEYNHMFHLAYTVKQNKIKTVLLSDIENIIEQYAIQNNILSKSDICCGNIILLFTLTLKSFRSYVDTQSFLSILFSDFTIFRKYYTIVMNMSYKLMDECFKKKDYSHAQKFLNCYYPCINSIRQQSLVPNEGLMSTIKKFNLIDSNKLAKNVKEDQEKGNINTPSGPGLKSFIKNEMNDKNLYLCYNFTCDGFVSEDEIVKKVNENNNKSGRLEFKFKVIGNRDKIIVPKLRFKKGKNIIDSDIYSQKHILEMLTKEYNSFNQDLDVSKLNAKTLLDASMNIFLFIRNNSKDFQITMEISDVLNTIFYIYFEKYLEQNKK